MDLAFKSLQVRSSLHESGESKKNGETREQSGSACERKPCEKTEKRAGEENEELLREFECAFKANKIINQTQGSFRGNVWQPRIAPLNTTRHPSEAKRAIEAYHAQEKTIIQRSFTRRDTATTVQGFQTGPKAAWINDEDKLWGQEGEEKTELNISMRGNNKQELQWEEEKKYGKEKKQNKKKDEGERKEEEEQKKEKERGEEKKDEQRKKMEKGAGKERKQKKKEERGEEKEEKKKEGEEQKKKEERGEEKEKEKKKEG